MNFWKVHFKVNSIEGGEGKGRKKGYSDTSIFTEAPDEEKTNAQDNRQA